ncbi:hypothetical protein PHYSODRAFT_284809, partial [Phytophthora sojae]
MKEKEDVSSSHVLTADDLQHRFVGREEAIKAASSCFARIITVAKRDVPGNLRPIIPVCAGISGLGKTRMLEEGGMILRDVMELGAERVASVIVPYDDMYSPQEVEQSMPIAASFSWRMLYRFFLAENCSVSFKEWFKSRLPVNGHHLTFATAVQAIECKLRKRQPDTTVPLYLFLGIDDYQCIKYVGAHQENPDVSLIH